MKEKTAEKWLLLIHQLPPKPNALRVKIWRRLQKVGAVAVKQSVYAMPLTDQSQEDLVWILKEIVNGGGEGSIIQARFVEGLTDDQIKALFQNARKLDYEKIITEANTLMAELSSGAGEQNPKESSYISKLQNRLDDIVSIDFFQSPERGTAEILLREIKNLSQGKKSSGSHSSAAIKQLQGKTWVTRDNIFVDRMACAWLIRRFIDKAARIKFVSRTRYTPEKGELRFDMFEGEFTHEGDRCSFEVMIEKFDLQDRALTPIAEIVHDIDLKDERYGRVETEGFKALLTGLVSAEPDEKFSHDLSGFGGIIIQVNLLIVKGAPDFFQSAVGPFQLLIRRAGFSGIYFFQVFIRYKSAGYKLVKGQKHVCIFA